MVRRGRMSTVSSFDRGSVTLVTPGPAAMTISLGVESTPGVQVGYRHQWGAVDEGAGRRYNDELKWETGWRRSCAGI